MLCPCGSKLEFSACCQPYITGTNANSSLDNPEKLMRSRFSAYAVKNAEYIYNTYGEIQRQDLTIAELQTWADECIWLALKIHQTSGSQVEFSAYYINNNTLCELREISNFAIQHNQWRYIDGTITMNVEIANVKRNDACPCNQFTTAWSAKKGKKFKHCCGK